MQKPDRKAAQLQYTGARSSARCGRRATHGHGVVDRLANSRAQVLQSERAHPLAFLPSVSIACKRRDHRTLPVWRPTSRSYRWGYCPLPYLAPVHKDTCSWRMMPHLVVSENTLVPRAAAGATAFSACAVSRLCSERVIWH